MTAITPRLCLVNTPGVITVCTGMVDANSEAGRVQEGEAPRVQSQAVLDAMADARTLVVNVRAPFGSALWIAQDSGSRAVVAVLDGDVSMAGYNAENAAHAAFRAIRGLRG